MLELGLKVLLAPLLFILILFSAQSIRMRWAAGMLLTFPALNGISLFVASSKSTDLSSGMLPMVAVNGLLCFGYIYCIEHEITVAGRKLTAGWLFGIAVAIWILILLLSIKIPSPWQLAWVVVVAILSISSASLLWLKRDASTPVGSPKSFCLFMKDKQTLGRTAIFAGILGLVLVFSALGRDTIAGQLGAAPVLPLFALFTIANSDDALAKLKSAKVTVPLGPALAMAFVLWYAEQVYQTRLWQGLLLMIFGWTVCFGSIVAVSWILNATDRARTGREAA